MSEKGASMHILFMIPNLGHGGAEKVLVNLVNNMDKAIFDITVLALYDDNGINKAFLSKEITYKYCFKRSFPGVAHLLKLFSPETLYKNLVGNEDYDIVISFLEGQTARILSGSNKKKVCWIHMTVSSVKTATKLFRSEKEAKNAYESFDYIVSVSKDVQDAFMKIFQLEHKGKILYNTNQTSKIIEASTESISDKLFWDNEINLCAMGSLISVKGFDRLIRIHARLVGEGFPVHTYILGEGKDKDKLLKQVEQLNVVDSVTFLGYQKNPYRYIVKSDLFICSSFSEGFSTAVTESLILGTPVCTVEVSGMKELLGQNNEFGIVTENTEDALYEGIRELICNPEMLDNYRKKAQERGKSFDTSSTVKAVEEFLKMLGNL